MILATFKNNNKEYVFSLNKNKIEYGYKNNKEILNDLTQEEIEMMDYILSNIIISSDRNNHVKCGVISYNNKKFQVMYDKISKRKFCYEIVDGKYLFPNKNDNAYLFSKFNSSILYSNEFDKQIVENNEDKINLIVKYKGKKINVELILFVLSFTMVLMFIGALGYDLYKQDKEVQSIVQENEIPYSNKIMEEAINNNDKLTPDEKEFIISDLDVMEENQEYIDVNQVVDNLKNLDIEYILQPDQYCLDNNAVAYYDRSLDKIIITNATSFDQVINNSKLTAIMHHEVEHVFTSPCSSLGVGFRESTNHVLSYEYSGDYESAKEIYFDNCICLYSMCEIIGTDSLKKLQFMGDVTPLFNELMGLINDEDLAYQFILEVDMLTKENVIDRDLLKNGIYDKIGKYFFAKYNYDITEDKEMMMYLVNSGFVTKQVDSLYVNYDYNYKYSIVNPKGYFNDNYIKKHPQISCQVDQISNDKLKKTSEFKVENENRENINTGKSYR